MRELLNVHFSYVEFVAVVSDRGKSVAAVAASLSNERGVLVT